MVESREAAAARVAQPGNGKRTLSPEEPAVATPSVPLGDVLASARFNGGDLDPRTSDSDYYGDAVLGDEDGELADQLLTGDEDEDLYDTDDSDNDDSDIEFENDDEPLDQFGDGEATGSKDDDLIQAPVEFLGATARFATVESTAGFMLLRAGDAGQDGGGEITVYYRYVWFTRDQTRGPGVAVYNGPKLHPVRFLVPTHPATAADPASSLRLAGAALADMEYPRRFNAQLQALWSNLIAAAPVRVIPPRATRVEVDVNVGILRCGDRTPERMACVRAALADMARGADAWPFLRHVGMVMRLPAPVSVVSSEDDNSARPAKRRRFAAAEEERAICCEVLERGLAAWPRCSHVFHGKCLEQLLVRGDLRCPLCRSELMNGKAPG